MGSSNSTQTCLLDKPFRIHKHLSSWDTSERDGLREITIHAKPYEMCDYADFNILLLGPCQAGKSSFRNTIKSAFTSEVSHRDDTGKTNGSLTKKYTISPFRDVDGRKMGHVRLVDMPGFCQEFGGKELNTDIIGGILDGKIPHNYEFGGNEILLGEQMNENRIHCVVMVLNGANVNLLDTDTEHNNIKDVLYKFRTEATKRDIPTAVVLTHVDDICLCVKEDLSRVFHCKTVLQTIKTVDPILAIDSNRIFIVQNYSGVKSVETDESVDCLALLTLKYLIQYCREYADCWLDRRDQFCKQS